jgi:GNAT superfamily N-acetyltransferase
MKPSSAITKDCTDRQIDRFATAYAAQSERLHQLDNRLRLFKQEAVSHQIRELQAQQREFLHIDDFEAAAAPMIVEYPPDSGLLALFPQRSGMTSLVTLPSPDTGNAAHALIEALEDYWRKEGATGGLISWPTSDLWVEPVLHQHGFHTYSVLALRGPDELVAASHALPPDMTIRAAQPADEDTLVELIVEQVAFHTAYTPFDRVVPGTAADARSRLQQLWSGAEGASIVFAAVIDDRVVGMIECSVSDMTGMFSYLPPATYGYINIAAVAEAQRGKGIGHYLLVAAMQALKSQGIEAFYLYYVPDNPLSSRFWQRKGFRPLLTTYQKRYTNDA